MRLSIATVSLGGTLPEKLRAIAGAGFDGVELFEADVLAHEALPRETGRPRSKAVSRRNQGAVNLVINTEPEGIAHSHQIVHGPSVVALGLRVGDAAAAFTRAEAPRIPAFRQPVGPGELDIPAARGLGGSRIYFTDLRSALGRVGEIEFEPLAEAPAGPLGAGVQHVAFATDDIFAAAEACRSAGLELLPIPENYYNDLKARFALVPELIAHLRAGGILYDEDEGGRYFQLCTRAFQERFFFEIVQRDGYRGVGAPNAPIRLAAQARLARGLAMPRL